MSDPQIPPLPSVGVGNLRTGGTGKTPLVEYLVGKLEDAAIVTLGYRRKYRGCFTSLENPTPYHLGDEGYMLFKKTGKLVVACKDRMKGTLMAKERGAKAVVYDDVFQYFKIKPHVSILLLRPNDPYSYVLPFGPLREPFVAYRYADILVFNFKLEGVKPPPKLGKPTFTMRYKIRGMVEKGRVKDVRGRRLYAFCAIADPFSFFGAIKRSGGIIVKKRIFPDHWWISKETLAYMKTEAERLNATPICTEKDFYRLGDDSLAYLKVETEVEKGLTEAVFELLKERTKIKPPL